MNTWIQAWLNFYRQKAAASPWQREDSCAQDLRLGSHKTLSPCAQGPDWSVSEQFPKDFCKKWPKPYELSSHNNNSTLDREVKNI
jgi:hypothetical protein